MTGIYEYASSIFLPNSNYSEYTHHTLLIDRSFTREEASDITSAAYEWMKETNHRVIFDIVYLPNTREKLTKDCILIVKVGPDYPDILIYDLNNHNTVLGLYVNTQAIPTIELVSERMNRTTFRMVALHELGHALGLDHNEGLDGVNTLMYPTIDLGSDCITFTDLEKFCKLHHCDPNKLKN